MILGGPVFEAYSDPESWVKALERCGYSAAYCPVDTTDSDDTIKAYARAAEAAGIVIAEVGAWSNPISPDEKTRQQAVQFCKESLMLADKIGARCCVNIAGSRSRDNWDGPHPDNLTEETFDRIVEVTREIIDEVNPSQAFFTLEPMPWIYPDSPDSYLSLLQAVNRKQFAVHFDPANMICSPQRFFNNGAFIRECIQKLGPYIKSCHAKDIALGTTMTTHLDEVRPGLGSLDYRVFLQELDKLAPDIPLMTEHLTTEEEYREAAEYIRSTAKQVHVSL